MIQNVFTRRLSALSLAAALGLASTAQATLLWYDGFAVSDADDGAGPNYVLGTLAGQQGGSDAGAPGGIGFFDDAGGNPNPWLGVNNTDPTDQDNVIAGTSLSRINQSPASTGGMSSDQPVDGCCNVARSSRDFNTPLQNLTGTYYMGFLVNFGAGNRTDPHYRAIEFWNGKNTDAGNGQGRVGDGVLNMSIGISSFGNYNGAVNQGADPDPNTQLSVRVDGIRELFGMSQELKYQLEEHLEFGDNRQFGQTHSIVVKFDLTNDDVETGGVGDTVSFFLNPEPGDTTEPAPSLVVPNVDLLLDSMSSLVAFQFNQTSALNPGGFDELRVGTTWSDVAVLGVPEPTSLSILGLGVLGILATARRK